MAEGEVKLRCMSSRRLRHSQGPIPPEIDAAKVSDAYRTGPPVSGQGWQDSQQQSLVGPALAMTTIAENTETGKATAAGRIKHGQRVVKWSLEMHWTSVCASTHRT